MSPFRAPRVRRASRRCARSRLVLDRRGNEPCSDNPLVPPLSSGVVAGIREGVLQQKTNVQTISSPPILNYR
eukprot:scaffold50938_cov23-Tisochrysis_lutea.AAC.1